MHLRAIIHFDGHMHGVISAVSQNVDRESQIAAGDTLAVSLLIVTCSNLMFDRTCSIYMHSIRDFYPILEEHRDP